MLSPLSFIRTDFRVKLVDHLLNSVLRPLMFHLILELHSFFKGRFVLSVHFFNLMDLSHGDFDTAVVVFSFELVFQAAMLFDEDVMVQLPQLSEMRFQSVRALLSTNKLMKLLPADPV